MGDVNWRIAFREETSLFLFLCCVFVTSLFCACRSFGSRTYCVWWLCLWKLAGHTSIHCSIMSRRVLQPNLLRILDDFWSIGVKPRPEDIYILSVNPRGILRLPTPTWCYVRKMETMRSGQYGNMLDCMPTLSFMAATGVCPWSLVLSGRGVIDNGNRRM